MDFILNRPALTILWQMGSRRNDALFELKGKGFFSPNTACAFCQGHWETAF